MTAKQWLKLSIALHVVTIIFFVGKRFYYSRFDIVPNLKEKVYADEYNNLRNSVLDYLPVDSNDIVFIGTSITQGFPTDELVGAKNRGTGSNTTTHMIKRLHQVQGAKMVFVEGGINDLMINKATVEQVADNYRDIASRLHNIVIQSVPPVSDPSYNDSVYRLNVFLKGFCKDNNIPYLDIYDTLGGRSGLKKEYSIDGIHPNGLGYKVWAGEVKKYLTQLK